MADARITAACGENGTIRTLITTLINAALNGYLLASTAQSTY